MLKREHTAPGTATISLDSDHATFLSNSEALDIVMHDSREYGGAREAVLALPGAGDSTKP